MRYDDLSREQAINLLIKRDARRKLGLVWERDEIEHENALNDDFVVMDLDIGQSSSPAGAYQNLLIEGDNFDALRWLRMTHSGRVRAICIDPPYNTGNKDWVYNDHYVSKEDRFRHSTWLEFLYRRFLLARDLLTPDGVVVVFINDDNRAKIELLMDEVFPGMRIGSMVWRTRDSTSAKGRNFSDVHEHILVYGGPEFSFQGSPKSKKKYKNPDKDPRGLWNVDPLTLGFDRWERPNLFYPVQNPKTGYWYPCDPNIVWRYASEKIEKNPERLRSETMEEWVRQDKIVFPAPDEERVEVWETMEALLDAIDRGDIPRTPKKQLPLLSRETPDLDFWVGKPVGFGRPGFKKHWRDLRSHTNPVGSWIARLNEDDDEEETLTIRSRQAGEGGEALQAIFGKKVFNYPKPPSLLQEILRQTTKPNDVVLDFFAGSGTTAQCVMALNTEDGGSRRFIMVSSRESTEDDDARNVCRDVCAQRLRRVIRGVPGMEPLRGDFAYLMASRIAFEDIVYELTPDHVWLAIQAMHDLPLQQLDPSRDVHAGITADDVAIVYCNKFQDGTEAALREVIGDRCAFVYSWSIGPVKEAFRGRNGIEIRHARDELVRRFRA